MQAEPATDKSLDGGVPDFPIPHVPLGPAPVVPTGRSIYRRLVDVLEELPSIGKNQRNEQQGFNFRGIDAVLNELNPLLSKHGVFFVPTVLERIASHRETRSGGTLWVVNLHVRYTFYGIEGDWIIADGWGEGTDSGDKATQKAMTGAMKYVLFQVFAIATDAADDADRTTPEESGPARPPVPSREEVARIRELATQAEIGDWVRDQGFGWPWTFEACAAIEAKADEVLCAPFVEQPVAVEADPSWVESETGQPEIGETLPL